MSRQYTIYGDFHTHSIASGHGTTASITQLANQAARLGLKALSVTDHGPATPGSASPSYFMGLPGFIKKRFNIRLLLGCELNILNPHGALDLPDHILQRLDLNIASLHPQNFTPQTMGRNTEAVISAMEHPNIHIIGHPDDAKYPLDYEAIVRAAVRTGTFLELNNASAAPGGYRGNTIENDVRILLLCKKYSHPITLGSDSHGPQNLGQFKESLVLLKSTDFPEELILNCNPELLSVFPLKKSGR